jgi:hypothetical protein
MLIQANESVAIASLQNPQENGDVIEKLLIGTCATNVE